jgi:prophage regulatory protein
MSNTAPRKQSIPRLANVTEPAPMATSTDAKPLVNFDTMPDSAWVREAVLTGQKGLLPFGRASFWRKVKIGEFPAPRSFGPRTTAWNVGEVRAWLAERQSTAFTPSTAHLQTAQAKARMNKMAVAA